MKNTKSIDRILELVPVQEGAEIAILRTEWNLDDIKEGTFGGKVNPDYVSEGNDLNFAKKLAVSYGVPIIEFERTTYESKRRTQQRRERREGNIIKEIYGLIENYPIEDKDIAQIRLLRDQKTLENSKSYKEEI